MQYPKENVKDEVDFFTACKHQRFLQIDTIILDVCCQACPNYPKQQVSISLQYLKKEVSGDVDFLLADKHERFLQIDTMIFDGDDWSKIPTVPKIASM